MSTENTISSINNITLEIAPIQVEPEIKLPLLSEKEVWSLHIPEQFPILQVEHQKKAVVLNIGPPHQDYTIETKMKNGKLEGKATLKNPQKKVIATFTYVESEMTGKCKIYYETGKLYYSGYLLKGYRHGLGKEYDSNGNLVFEGYYYSGNKNESIKRMENMKGYWEEKDFSGFTISVCKKDVFGNNEGLCYFYNNGILDRASYCHNNTEIGLANKFGEASMCQYKNNEICYYGTYSGSIYSGFERRSGAECDKDIKHLKYEGDFVNGVRAGFGTSYNKDGTEKYSGEWIYGMKKSVFTKGLILIIVIVEIILLAVDICIPAFFYKFTFGVFIFILYFVVYYYIRKMWSLCPLTVDFIPKTAEKPLQYGTETLISNYRFTNIRECKINGLRRLKTLRILENSFVEQSVSAHFVNSVTEDNEKSFHILNCESLESIQIGEYSFCDFAGEFELKNLPQLQSIQIGAVRSYSCNFYGSSFVIRGTELILNI